MRLVVVAFMATVFAILSASTAVSSATVTVDQRTYHRVDDARFKGRLYLYAADIESTSASPGFKPFDLHVIVGRYRAPLLGTKASLEPRDLERIVLSRKDDIWRDKLRVTQVKGNTKTFKWTPLGDVVVRVRQVVPVKNGTDRVTVDVS